MHNPLSVIGLHWRAFDIESVDVGHRLRRDGEGNILAGRTGSKRTHFLRSQSVECLERARKSRGMCKTELERQLRDARGLMGGIRDPAQCMPQPTLCYVGVDAFQWLESAVKGRAGYAKLVQQCPGAELGIGQAALDRSLEADERDRAALRV